MESYPTNMAETRPPIESFLQKQDLEPEVSSDAVIKKLRGPKGDKGDIGLSGKDGIDGKDGKDGESIVGPKGERGFMGPKGDNGDSMEIEELEALVLSLLPEPIVIPELAPKDLIEKINRAKTAKISRSRVEGLDDVENKAASTEKRLQNFISLGGSRSTSLSINGKQPMTGVTTLNFVGGTLTPLGDGTTASYTPPASSGGQVNSVVAGSGISVNNTDPANPVVSATGTTVTFYADTVSGVINSSNTVFTVPNTITTALALWLANSIYQPGVDFTVTGAKQITMTVAPDISLSGQPFWLSHI